MKKYKIASLFSGCGGLDLGFANAGFEISYANEYDRVIWDTYRHNHKHTKFDERSILDIKTDDIPDIDGLIGGPPCQSWSLAGSMRGVDDPRGKLFYEYVRVLKHKKPLFFLAENVAGIVSSAHIREFENILNKFTELGYEITYKLLNAKYYGVPQDRQRVIIVGILRSIGKKFIFPEESHKEKDKIEIELKLESRKPIVTLKDVIGDMSEPLPAKPKNYANQPEELNIPNHEYMTGGFSTMYMSRNRRRGWDEPSFTIQAGGRHAPLHPSAHEMIKKGKDEWIFNHKYKNTYRRLSVRECARIQTFPDSFIFKYSNIADGYKMIGNAVPVLLAEAIARKILKDLK